VAGSVFRLGAPSQFAPTKFQDRLNWYGSRSSKLNPPPVSAIQRIIPFLWFDDQAEEAARFYVGIFENSRIVRITRYGEAGHSRHGRPAGTVMVVDFELEGQPFTALNGGPGFTFNEALSLQIRCETQEEIDYFWEKLSAGGDASAQQCGWLKDKYGLSWQVTPTMVIELISGPDAQRSGAAMEAMLRMKKLDIAALQQAYNR
jgi:predicted 3-demethylubiquinone-9 3-methyltransferase (glyoxalase superfamily)